MLFRSKNTTEKGQVRFIIFREGSTWYGVALEFNIVVDAASKNEALNNLDSAIKNYVDTVRIHRIRESVLNQDTSSEYSQLWKDLNAGKTPRLRKIDEEEQQVQQPSLEVAFFGYRPQPA